MKLSRLLPLIALLLSSCTALGGSATRELVYVVEASGGAWGAATKARAAMESLDVEELHMSGARAVFKNSQRLDEDDIAAAFEEQGMKLESYKKVRRAIPAARYTVDTGVTWAVTAGKVRAALIDATGAIDVYFEEKIEVLVGDSNEFPVTEAKRVLKEHEVKFTEISRSSI